jgi:hypothetical protein
MSKDSRSRGNQSSTKLQASGQRFDEKSELKIKETSEVEEKSQKETENDCQPLSAGIETENIG